jgi:uncharacterized protein
VLSTFKATPGHVFIPDAVSLSDGDLFDLALLSGSKHATDTYLLGLARSLHRRLVTLDRRLKTEAVKGGKTAPEYI